MVHAAIPRLGPVSSEGVSGKIVAGGLLLLCGSLLLLSCSARSPRQPLDRLEGVFYFESAMTYEGFDDSGVHLSSPMKSKVYLIPPKYKNGSALDAAYAEGKYLLYFRTGDPAVKGRVIYRVDGAVVQTRLQRQPNEAEIEGYRRLVQFVWPDLRREELQDLASSVMHWASRHSKDRLFLANSCVPSDDIQRKQ